MSEQKYWYVVRLNVREVNNDDANGVLRTEYCIVQGTSYEDVAAQLRSINKPFKEKNEYGETLTLKKCFKIHGSEFERKSDAMDYLIDLKHKINLKKV